MPEHVATGHVLTMGTLRIALPSMHPFATPGGDGLSPKFLKLASAVVVVHLTSGV
jgi:hypothetical protein